MNQLAQNYNNIRNSLLQQQVKLIAVSKTFPETDIREVYALGQRDFAENYAQEFQKKAQNLSDLEIQWHYIGNIQSNKTKLIATYAHWVHSVSSEKQALRLNKDRPLEMPKLNVLIEFNLSGVDSRHGVNNIEEVIALAKIISSQDKLILRGLMGVASPGDTAVVTNQFKAIQDIFNQLKQLGYTSVDTLSIGMSNDYQLAITNGSTMVRIGSLIFGNRNYSI